MLKNVSSFSYNSDIGSRCRMGYKQSETIDHIASRCEVLAKIEYIERHNKAAANIHWKICNDLQIKTSDNWYEHQPETVTYNEIYTMQGRI